MRADIYYVVFKTEAIDIGPHAGCYSPALLS